MKTAAFVLLVAALLALAVGQAFSGRGGEPVSGTRAFSIDGRRFFVENPAVDDYSSVHRETAKMRIDTRRVTEQIGSVLASRTVQPLREEPAETGASPLPAGLEPDHVLRLETGSGPVEIAFGRLAGGHGAILARLRSSGWECRETDGHGAAAATGRITKGKEASLVLIERGEGRFLAIRRTVR